MHIQNKADECDLTMKCDMYRIHELPCMCDDVTWQWQCGTAAGPQLSELCLAPQPPASVCPQYSCRQHRDTVTRTRTML